jgi:histidinol-phosphate/aromatic aminotransferase/cobyric acid decarboxylase-like protein
MRATETPAVTEPGGLTALVAQKAHAGAGTILPFTDFTVFMVEALKAFYKPGSRLVAAGHVTPEIELAAAHADTELLEMLGPTPFAAHLGTVLEAVQSPCDMIYVANPNRVTGSHFSLSDLDGMARAVPEGAVLVDEYYFDHFGITGLPLVELYDNVVIIRSFTATFAISSFDAGYVLAGAGAISLLGDSLAERKLSSKLQKTILANLIDEEALVNLLYQTHDESLRLATALSRMNVQCRMSPTDFVLMRVADSTRVGNFLARNRIQVDNLDGYPQLTHYLRYRIRSVGATDRLIEAFNNMPSDYYLMPSIDHRPTSLRASGSGDTPVTASKAGRSASRLRTKGADEPEKSDPQPEREPASGR